MSGSTPNGSKPRVHFALVAASPFHHFVTPSPPSLARELVVKRREADGERLQCRHGVLKVHVEAVLADLAELQK